MTLLWTLLLDEIHTPSANLYTVTYYYKLINLYQVRLPVARKQTHS
jgi:hypothetical protein